jgi:phage tail-like protein
MTTYRLVIAGQPIAHFDVAEVEYRNGGGGYPMKITGVHTVTAVTLKRGVVTDPRFASWLRGAKIRQNVVLQPLDGRGVPLASYSLGSAWVSHFKGPTLDANANAIAIQHIKMENEGFEIDQAAMPPEWKIK